jgi:phosphatidylglycerophosphate synthase
MQMNQTSSSTTDPESRRPLKSRDTGWARALAAWLARMGATPNVISIKSIGFALLALVCFLLAPDAKSTLAYVLLYVGAIAGIQLRLLCNLLDGMVAVEHGKKSATGGLFNELPDRVADVLILVGAGYSTTVEPGVVKLFGELPLGWSCAVVALWTAYIRSLGAELTGKHFFMGPMAKPHRMFWLTMGCVALILSRITGYGDAHQILVVTLTWIFVGGLVTCVRRLQAIAGELERKVI